jgi:hypothetical protein
MIKGIHLISIVLILVFYSCAKKTRIDKPVRLPNKSSKFLQSKIESNNYDYETFTAKFTANTNFNNERISFKGSLRIKQDSIIWISLTKLGGVEMIRLILTQDSIKFINKWDKEYFIEAIENLDKLQEIELGYSQIQAMLLGELIDYLPDNKFHSSNDNITYLLTSRNKGKIKKASTIIEGDSLMELSVQDKKLQKALEKKPNEDFTIRNYYLFPDNYWLARQTISHVNIQQAIDIVYSDYEIKNEKIPFAMKQSIRIASKEKSGGVEFKFLHIEFNKKNSYPFKISSKYVPIKKR